MIFSRLVEIITKNWGFHGYSGDLVPAVMTDEFTIEYKIRLLMVAFVIEAIFFTFSLIWKKKLSNPRTEKTEIISKLINMINIFGITYFISIAIVSSQIDKVYDIGSTYIGILNSAFYISVIVASVYVIKVIYFDYLKNEKYKEVVRLIIGYILAEEIIFIALVKKFSRYSIMNIAFENEELLGSIEKTTLLLALIIDIILFLIYNIRKYKKTLEK